MAYWAWAPKGWLRVAGMEADDTFEHGYLDFAGSGVVRMLEHSSTRHLILVLILKHHCERVIFCMIQCLCSRYTW